MVTRETSYIGQLYFGLSTDDADVVEWHNGDRILLMDQDKMMVYDEAAFDFHEIPMGGGGGGGGSTIVSKTITANGTYDAADDSADGYNPVTVNVTPVYVTAPLTITNNKTGSSGAYRSVSLRARGPHTALNGQLDLQNWNYTGNGNTNSHDIILSTNETTKQILVFSSMTPSAFSFSSSDSSLLGSVQQSSSSYLYIVQWNTTDTITITNA